jgi:hypothetical protein
VEIVYLQYVIIVIMISLKVHHHQLYMMVRVYNGIPIHICKMYIHTPIYI